MKTMADIRRIVDLYELYGSYKKVARELDISPNTAKKYLRRVKDVQEGTADEILPKNRKIIQPSRVLTETFRQKIHQYLESNLEHPRKQRLTAKRIWELLVTDGHKIGYTQASKMKWPAGNVPTAQYANYDLKRATISRYSLVKCEGNFYSVPDTYRPRLITLKIMVDRIALLDGNDVIASHRRLTGKQQYSLDITHYIKTFHRKPGALPNARVLAQVDELILDLFNRYYLDDPKGFLPILDLMQETSPEALSGALTILNEENIPSTYDTLRFFLHQTAEQKVEPFAFCGGFAVTEPDLVAFDQMMVG